LIKKKKCDERLHFRQHFDAAMIIFVVSEKKAFEHFLLGSNVNLCPAVADNLDFPSA
jgi:hypothetical protein